MYFDTSRLADLKEMKEEMDNPQTPLINRKYAYRTYQKIKAQLHDPKLVKMRERLMKATDKADRYETWKIRNQIKDYMKEEVLSDRNY